MADAQVSLDKVLHGVAARALNDEQSWEELKLCIDAARTTPSTLQGHSEEAMQAGLEFLVRLKDVYPLSVGKVTQCLKVLLHDVDWMHAAKCLPLETRTEIETIVATREDILKQLTNSSLDTVKAHLPVGQKCGIEEEPSVYCSASSCDLDYDRSESLRSLAEQLKQEWDAVEKSTGAETLFIPQSGDTGESVLSESDRSSTSTPSASGPAGSFLQKCKYSGMFCPKDGSKKGRESWVADRDMVECFDCKTSFSLTVRRHHCRECGNIFCAACTRNRIAYTPTGHLRKEGYREKQKTVCTACHTKISEIQFDMLFAPLYVSAA